MKITRRILGRLSLLVFWRRVKPTYDPSKVVITIAGQRLDPATYGDGKLFKDKAALEKKRLQSSSKYR